MYDIIEKTVGLTHDEIEIVKEALERYQEAIVSVPVECTIECLLDKLSEPDRE